MAFASGHQDRTVWEFRRREEDAVCIEVAGDAPSPRLWIVQFAAAQTGEEAIGASRYQDSAIWQ